jgi:hypothetical protein
MNTINTTLPENSKFYISWTAIFVGALFAVGIGFLLHLFNAGLGLSAFTTDEKGLATLAIGGFIWLLICAFVSMFIAGYVTGIIAKPLHPAYKACGIIHGFAAWSFAFIILVVLAAHAGFLMASTNNLDLTKSNTPVSAISVLHATKESTKNVILYKKPVVEKRVNVPASDVKVVNTENVTNTIGQGILAAFFIFLLGAIGACAGGHVGIRHEHVYKTEVKT